MGRSFAKRAARPAPPRTPDDYTALRMDWLEAITCDMRLTGIDLRVAYLVCFRVNRQIFEATGELRAWPTQAWLGEQLGGKHADVIRRSTKRIEECGYWQREISHGSGRATEYILIPQPRKARCLNWETEIETPQADGVRHGKTQRVDRWKPDRSDGETPPDGRANPMKRTHREENPLNENNPLIYAGGSRISRDWAPDEELRAFARHEGFSDRQIDWLADNFRDYWSAQPGPKGFSADWAAVWRNSVRWTKAKRLPAPPADRVDWV